MYVCMYVCMYVYIYIYVCIYIYIYICESQQNAETQNSDARRFNGDWVDRGRHQLEVPPPLSRKPPKRTLASSPLQSPYMHLGLGAYGFNISTQWGSKFRTEGGWDGRAPDISFSFIRTSDCLASNFKAPFCYL